MLLLAFRATVLILWKVSDFVVSWNLLGVLVSLEILGPRF